MQGSMILHPVHYLFSHNSSYVGVFDSSLRKRIRTICPRFIYGPDVNTERLYGDHSLVESFGGLHPRGEGFFHGKKTGSQNARSDEVPARLRHSGGHFEFLLYKGFSRLP